MNFNFGEVLTRAWQITWKYKVLWWAGIVVSVMGLLSVPISLAFNPSFSSFTGSPPNVAENLVPILLGNGLILLLSLLAIPVTVMAMLVPSLATVQVERGSEQVHFGDLIKSAYPYFWRALGLYLLVYVSIFVVTMLLAGCLILISVLTLGFGALCIFPFFIAFIPAAILIYALIEQAISAIVVDNLGIGEAIQRAWQLVSRNFIAMAILSILIYLGSMIIGMILAIPMMIPFFGLIFNMDAQQFDPRAFEPLFRNMMLWMLVFSPLYAVLQGILMAFMQSAWTLTYMQLTRPLNTTPPVMIEANA